MKHTLTAMTAAALLALTACGATETAPQPEVAPAESTPNETQKVAAESDEWPLEPNPDGHEIHIMFQWIPETEDPQPVEARYYMKSSEDGMAYVTPALESDVLPSMDSGEWERFVYQIPDGGNVVGDAYVSDPPNEGRLSCVALEVTQEVVLDYQESQVGGDKVGCLAFTDDNHELHDHLGTPPVDVEFY